MTSRRAAAVDASQETVREPGLGRTALVYSLGRVGLFVLAALLVWSATGAAGHPLNGFPLLIAALLLSSVAGFFLLARPRQRFSEAMDAKRREKAEQIARRRARLEQDGS